MQLPADCDLTDRARIDGTKNAIRVGLASAQPSPPIVVCLETISCRKDERTSDPPGGPYEACRNRASADRERSNRCANRLQRRRTGMRLSLIHISEPTRQAEISYAV